MKFAIIIPDGAADEPLPQLAGRTPLEAARTPNMDRIARQGELGLVRTIPDGFESGSDVAIMSLLGYDPREYHTGRAPLEAAARQIPLSSQDWVFRCNLVTVVNGAMKDHSAGGISDAEARQLLGELARLVAVPQFEFHPGVSYRNLLVHRGDSGFDLTTRPPHEIPNEQIASYLPRGRGSEILNRIMDQSAELFRNHPINCSRMARGLNPATQVWLWGQGHATTLPTFADKFGIRSGCMITGVDLLRGLARLLGWQILEVPGMTSFHDTNYIGQGEATADAPDRYDIVVSHIEAPDEASHQADVQTKVESIEAIDRHIVGPVLQKLEKFNAWRILVLPDHPTNIATRKHGNAPTPFALAGAGIHPNGSQGYSENSAANAGLHIQNGHELMHRFLHGR